LTQLASPVLVLGPAYSGKSELAMSLLAPDRGAVVIGTADEREVAFRDRLAFLRSLRPAHWRNVQGDGDLAGALEEALASAPQVLVDAIGQWIGGVLSQSDATGEPGAAELDRLAQQSQALVRVVARCRAAGAPRLVVVTSEAGASPPPVRRAERVLRQALGGLNRRLAAEAATVVTVTAGLPQILKG
jgi:adenosylcobinamide kinase/adenosylcobinamide-phosphate guanylyltransferase